MSQRRFCTFYADGLLLGIAIERVEEVLRDEAITPVPLADPAIAGLVNLRGQIVTAIDARRRLGLTARSDTSAPTIVVIRTNEEAVSLLVDRAGDVVEVDDDGLVAVPVTVAATIRALTTGAYGLAGDLMLVLDTDQTLAITSGEEDTQ
ncbi:MAG: chemotaxis protein CheW [Acidimicrobiales bacterium]